MQIYIIMNFFFFCFLFHTTFFLLFVIKIKVLFISLNNNFNNIILNIFFMNRQKIKINDDVFFVL